MKRGMKKKREKGRRLKAQRTREGRKGSKEKDTLSLTEPKKECKILDLDSQWPPPKHAFVVLRGESEGKGRPWQLGQWIGAQEPSASNKSRSASSPSVP